MFSITEYTKQTNIIILLDIKIEKRNIFPFLLLPTFPKIERSETDILLLTHQLKLNAARPIILRHIPI